MPISVITSASRDVNGNIVSSDDHDDSESGTEKPIGGDKGVFGINEQIPDGSTIEGTGCEKIKPRGLPN